MVRAITTIFLLVLCGCAASAEPPAAQSASRSPSPIPVLPAPPPPWPVPTWLIGMTPDEVTHYLGTPTRDVVREKNRLFDYYNATCNFSIFLKRPAPD